jgi:hypothetical protein
MEELMRQFAILVGQALARVWLRERAVTPSPLTSSPPTTAQVPVKKDSADGDPGGRPNGQERR